MRAEREVLAAHLAVTLPATGRIELVRIVSDADLVGAWLANVGDLRDDEAAAHRGEQEDRFRSIADLVVPPKLLVLYVGIWAAQFADLPDLILETVVAPREGDKGTTDELELQEAGILPAGASRERTLSWPQPCRKSVVQKPSSPSE